MTQPAAAACRACSCNVSGLLSSSMRLDDAAPSDCSPPPGSLFTVRRKPPGPWALSGPRPLARIWAVRSLWGPPLWETSIWILRCSGWADLCRIKACHARTNGWCSSGSRRGNITPRLVAARKTCREQIINSANRDSRIFINHSTNGIRETGDGEGIKRSH